MLQGFNRVPYSKLGGLITAIPPSQVPRGSALIAEDIEFTARTIRTRSGLTQVFQSASKETINGLDVFIREAAQSVSAQMLIAYGASGNLYKEDPAGTGVLTPIGQPGGAGQYMNMSTAFDRAYMCFTDLVTGQAAPMQYLEYQNQFFLDPVSIAGATVAQGTGMTAASFTAGAPGDIPQGIFYCVVMFMTRSGYISGITDNAFIPCVVTAANQQLVISNIPKGPSNCVARVLAFTQPGLSSAGPYYYIPESYTVDGMNGMVTSTIINDNTTTQYPVNFSSDALVSGTECDQFFDKITLPNIVGSRFLTTVGRMGYWGSITEPSTVFVSEPADPETIYGTNSRVFIAENNGERVQTVFEYAGEIYAAKERSGYVMTPTNTFPSTWTVTERWRGVGPCGPRALDVCEEFVIFAHRSGAYRYDGGFPEWISHEQSDTGGLWSRINWNYGNLISVKIDTETKRVFFCVPLDQSTVPNKIIVLDYRLGFASPIIQDVSENAVSSDGRKWAIYNIPAFQVQRIERVVANTANPANPPVDNTTAVAQLMLASSGADGAINMFDPSSHLDNGKGIKWRYQPAYVHTGGVLRLGGYDLQVSGAGQVGVTQVGDEDFITEKPALDVKPDRVTTYTKKTRGQATMWSLILHSVNDGDWCEISEVALWLNQAWPWSK